LDSLGLEAGEYQTFESDKLLQMVVGA